MSSVFNKMFTVPGIISYIPVLRNYYPKSQNSIQTKKWEAIKEADVLFANMKYEGAYELLNQYKFECDAEISWRICRALFKMSENLQSTELKREIMNEAYNVAQMASGSDVAALYKWKAIVSDKKFQLESMTSKIKYAHDVKSNLERALELDPSDYSVLYMLGHWCYNMSRLGWLQKKVISLVYGPPPQSTYSEAYKYFYKAEQISPRFYIPNLLMLGKVCYYMNQPYKAKYYLNLAATLPVKNEYERKCSIEAKKLDTELDKYDLVKEALLTDFAI